MTLLTMANLLPHGAALSWSGRAYNPGIVTLGNVVSGALFMGVAYWFVTDADAALPTRASMATPTMSDGDD